MTRLNSSAPRSLVQGDDKDSEPIRAVWAGKRVKFTRVPNWVVTHPIGDGPKITWLTIAMYCDNNSHDARLRVRTLMELRGKSRSSIHLHLSELKQAGLLAVRPRYHEGRRVSSLYILAWSQPLTDDDVEAALADDLEYNEAGESSNDEAPTPPVRKNGPSVDNSEGGLINRTPGGPENRTVRGPENRAPRTRPFSVLDPPTPEDESGPRGSRASSRGEPPPSSSPPSSISPLRSRGANPRAQGTNPRARSQQQAALDREVAQERAARAFGATMASLQYPFTSEEFLEYCQTEASTLGHPSQWVDVAVRSFEAEMQRRYPDSG